MTSRERINIALGGGQPDRVPVWCLLSLEHIVNHGTADGALPQTIEELVEAERRLTRRYRFDGALLYLPGTRRGSRVAEYLHKAIHDTPRGDPQHRFEEADPQSWERDLPVYETEDFYSSRQARDILGEDYHLGGWAADGFSRAIQWFPRLEDAFVATLEDPPRFKALVAYFDALSVVWGRAQVEVGGLESIQISSPYAGSSFISPRAYRDFVWPSVQRLAEAVQSAGGRAYLHTCGFIADRLELMADTGVEGLECMDPPPLGDVPLADAKRRVGGRLCLKGNLDSVNTLLFGAAETVDRTITDTLAAGMPGGGYILSTACSVAPRVPPERVRRLWELADQHGWY